MGGRGSRRVEPMLFQVADYTPTGWPAKMEEPVRSGSYAAEVVLAACGRREKLIQAESESAAMKYAKRCGCVVVFLTLLLVANWLLLEEPQRTLKRLLRGDTRIEPVSVTVWGQQQLIELRDEESVRYLTTAFRSSVEDGPASPRTYGPTYGIRLYFGSLQAGNAHVCALKGETGILVSFAEGWDTVTQYWVPFSEPMPRPVADLLAKMRKH